MRKLVISYISVLFLLMIVMGVTFAAFTDKSKVLGSLFRVGSADIKLLNDLAGGTDESNLLDEKPGPEFAGIGPFWSEDYLVKVYNNSSSDVTLSSNANYDTANDPDDLRSIIYVEPFDWTDSDNDGVLDDGELGTSYGRKTVVKWKTEGFSFGTLTSGNIKGLVLKMSTDSVSDTKQGKTAIFDFEFDSIGL